LFKRYPYTGWLVLSIALWCITAYRYNAQQRHLQPAYLAHRVSDDLSNRQQSLLHLLKREDLVQRIFADSLTPSDISTLEDLPFYLFAYTNDSLIYWNTNNSLVDCESNDTGKTKLLHTQKGTFLQNCVCLGQGNTTHRLSVLFPVLIIYPVENDYLRSHFPSDVHIPASTQVTSVALAGSLPVYISPIKEPACYLLIHQEDIQHHIPDNTLVILIIIALLISVSWIHLVMIEVAKRRSPLLGFALTACIINGVRALNYLYGLPFGLKDLKLFSPSLYASSSFLPSLGDLLLNTLCVMWMIVFLIRHVPYKKPLIAPDKLKWKFPVIFFIIVILTAYAYSFVNIIRSLVLDSNISFDVSKFYSINNYTVLGLLTIALLTAVSCVIIYILNIQLDNYLKRKRIKYFIIVLVGLCFAIPGAQSHEHFYLFLSAWLLLFILLLDVQGLELSSDLLTPHMIFWAAFVCIFCTGLLQYFNHIKEQSTRKIFDEHLVNPEPDNMMVYTFGSIAKRIQKDKMIRSFFDKPTANGRKNINEHFDASYLNGQLNKYQAKIFLFDERGHNLFNKDTTSLKELEAEKNISTFKANGLYYDENGVNDHYYIAYIPLVRDTTGTDKGHIIGHAYIHLLLKKARTEVVSLELLQPQGAKTNVTESEFPYAIYQNGKLTAHTNDYAFPDYVKPGTFPLQKYVFNNTNDASELWYNYNNIKTAVVVHRHNFIIETITLFSYLFGIEILLAVLLLIYQLYLSYILRAKSDQKLRLTLRKRIHLSMLFVVLVSFSIIGIVTIAFFTDQYKTNNRNKLESAMQTVQEAMQLYMRQNKGLTSEVAFDSVSHSTRFKSFVTGLANDQKIDINVFSINGALEVASQEEIYDRAVLARIMRPDAWYQLNNLGKSLLMQSEKIGEFSYLSSYVPLHDLAGTSFGYINVPSFSSEKELNFQISNIVVTLINLYAFIFLVSSMLTVIISRWLTGSFSIIIRQFGRLNLQRNERINWPFDDEIGLLVKEYNSMVRTLEENAAALAQSERESAWREMARQVAHEIKNPLTPMRLNIQHLQQALHHNYPNVKELAQKVTESLVEQIDNLSYIASEFSNFAKMPEARPEELDVSAIVEKATELYLNEQGTMVSLKKYHEPLPVNVDKSQLMRVITNLLENAKQAVPQGRIGYIEVSVLKEDGYAKIAVSDNGVGISEEAQKKIFQPYFTTKSSGTGLGLTMSKKIIEFWQGDISFETHEGKGTTFFIKIPLLKTQH